MSAQPDINEKMRAILIDWIIDVHLKFTMNDETLFLTVNIIDRYLSSAKILRTKLQLVGITAMLIAAKYEEIYPPLVKDFIFITDNAYTTEEVLAMESEILLTLDFDLMKASPLFFFERLCHLIAAEERVKAFARYLVELSFLCLSLLKFPPLMIAVSALYMSNKVFKIPQMHWKDQILSHVSFTESEIRECSKNLFSLLTSPQENANLTALSRKFAAERFGGISKASVCKK